MNLSVSMRSLSESIPTGTVPSNASAGAAAPTWATTATANGASNEGSATSTQLSKPAELLAALQKLEDEKPGAFATVVSGLAQEVRDAVSRASGGEGRVLTHLADALDQVATTGNLSVFFMRHPHGGHGHHESVRSYSRHPELPAETSDGSDGQPDGPTASGDSHERMRALLSRLVAEASAATSTETPTESSVTEAPRSVASAPVVDAGA
jgi:hypothetical protein